MDMMKLLKSEICIHKIRIDLWLKWYGIKSKINGLCCDNDCEMDEIADNLSNFQ